MDMCREVNKLFLPELVVLGTLYCIFLVTARWLEVLFLPPVVVWQARQYLLGQHRLDPTEIYDRLPSLKTHTMARLVLTVIFFLFLIGRFVSGVVSGYEADDEELW